MEPAPDEKQQFIDAYITKRRDAQARMRRMTQEELLADMDAHQEESWQHSAEMHWDLHQLQQMTNQLPRSRPAPLPAVPPGSTVPPDVGSRLEALEDSVSLLHAKLDTMMAQLAAWERDQGA